MKNHKTLTPHGKTTVLFPHNSKLSSKNLIPWANITPINNFYNVDKAELESVMSREKRLSQYYVPFNAADTVVLTAIIRSINAVGKYITGRALTISIKQAEDFSGSAALDGSGINISLGSLYDHRIPFHSRINALIGLTCHETFHIIETTPGFAELLRAKKLVRTQLNKTGNRQETVADFNRLGEIFSNKLHQGLHNIVEDRRIEALGLKKYSGYVYYMEELRHQGLFLHKNQLKDFEDTPDYSKDPVRYYEMLNLYISYRVLLPEMLEDFLSICPSDNKFKQLMKAVDEIVVPSLNFTTVWEQSKKLLELFPSEIQEELSENMPGFSTNPMQGMDGENYNATSKDIEALRETLKEMIEEVNDNAAEKKIDIAEPIKKGNPSVGKDQGRGDYNEFLVKAMNRLNPNFHKKIYDEARTLSKGIAKNLSFLDSRFNRTQETFELHSGELDESELFSLSFNRTIFLEEEETAGYSMDLAVLVDESGSMGSHVNGSSKIEQAQIAALSLALALNNHSHINLYIYGHTADDDWSRDTNEKVTMLRYLDPFEKANNINALFGIESRSNNADGYAIGYMGEVLAKGKASMKVLIVISDGQPAAHQYGGDEGIRHTREQVTRLERAGVFVVQIALDNLKRSEEMFTHFIPYNRESLGQNLKKVLMKKLIEISNVI